ncbi:unnamed protein product [Amoebophrya sp. A25]|nr:unnamed protein product [Amoebophrya sp. A25]|eukprot:GSA25T00004842001.1
MKKLVCAFRSCQAKYCRAASARLPSMMRLHLLLAHLSGLNALASHRSWWRDSTVVVDHRHPVRGISRSVDRRLGAVKSSETRELERQAQAIEKDAVDSLYRGLFNSNSLEEEHGVPVQASETNTVPDVVVKQYLQPFLEPPKIPNQFDIVQLSIRISPEEKLGDPSYREAIRAQAGHAYTVSSLQNRHNEFRDCVHAVLRTSGAYGRVYRNLEEDFCTGNGDDRSPKIRSKLRRVVEQELRHRTSQRSTSSSTTTTRNGVSFGDPLSRFPSRASSLGSIVSQLSAIGSGNSSSEAEGHLEQGDASGNVEDGATVHSSDTGGELLSTTNDAAARATFSSVVSGAGQLQENSSTERQEQITNTSASSIPVTTSAVTSLQEESAVATEDALDSIAAIGHGFRATTIFRAAASARGTERDGPTESREKHTTVAIFLERLRMLRRMLVPSREYGGRNSFHVQIGAVTVTYREEKGRRVVLRRSRSSMEKVKDGLRDGDEDDPEGSDPVDVAYRYAPVRVSPGASISLFSGYMRDNEAFAVPDHFLQLASSCHEHVQEDDQQEATNQHQDPINQQDRQNNHDKNMLLKSLLSNQLRSAFVREIGFPAYLELIIAGSQEQHTQLRFWGNGWPGTTVFNERGDRYKSKMTAPETTGSSTLRGRAPLLELNEEREEEQGDAHAVDLRSRIEVDLPADEVDGNSSASATSSRVSVSDRDMENIEQLVGDGSRTGHQQTGTFSQMLEKRSDEASSSSELAAKRQQLETAASSSSSAEQGVAVDAPEQNQGSKEHEEEFRYFWREMRSHISLTALRIPNAQHEKPGFARPAPFLWSESFKAFVKAPALSERIQKVLLRSHLEDIKINEVRAWSSWKGQPNCAGRAAPEQKDYSEEWIGSSMALCSRSPSGDHASSPTARSPLSSREQPALDCGFAGGTPLHLSPDSSPWFSSTLSNSDEDDAEEQHSRFLESPTSSTAIRVEKSPRRTVYLHNPREYDALLTEYAEDILLCEKACSSGSSSLVASGPRAQRIRRQWLNPDLHLSFLFGAPRPATENLSANAGLMFLKEKALLEHEIDIPSLAVEQKGRIEYPRIRLNRRLWKETSGAVDAARSLRSYMNLEGIAVPQELAADLGRFGPLSRAHWISDITPATGVAASLACEMQPIRFQSGRYVWYNKLLDVGSAWILEHQHDSWGRYNPLLLPSFLASESSVLQPVAGFARTTLTTTSTTSAAPQQHQQRLILGEAGDRIRTITTREQADAQQAEEATSRGIVTAGGRMMPVPPPPPNPFARNSDEMDVRTRRLLFEATLSSTSSSSTTAGRSASSSNTVDHVEQMNHDLGGISTADGDLPGHPVGTASADVFFDSRSIVRMSRTPERVLRKSAGYTQSQRIRKFQPFAA